MDGGRFMMPKTRDAVLNGLEPLLERRRPPIDGLEKNPLADGHAHIGNMSLNPAFVQGESRHGGGGEGRGRETSAGLCTKLAPTVLPLRSEQYQRVTASVNGFESRPPRQSSRSLSGQVPVSCSSDGCQLHRIEPWGYLRDLPCLLPRWKQHRVLELAPLH